MEFSEFFELSDKETIRRIADSADVSVKYLEMIAKKERTPSAEVSIVIERETNGAVRCESLRPSTDWTYIRGTLIEDRA